MRSSAGSFRSSLSDGRPYAYRRSPDDTLLDFLRLKSAYDRVAWNLRPALMAHEILIRSGRNSAAELWRRALVERTAQVSDRHLARLNELCQKYGMRLATVADRLSEKFVQPLAIDRTQTAQRDRSATTPPRTNNIDCSSIKPSQWPYYNFQRYGCGEINGPDSRSPVGSE